MTDLDYDTTPSSGPTTVNGASAEELKRIIDRIENLDEQKVGITEDIKLVKQEAKSEGFDVKVITEILKLRKKDASEVEQHDLLMAAYQRALGMI
jgi:uncharacterized protein (UPF0335 family)